MYKTEKIEHLFHYKSIHLDPFHSSLFSISFSILLYNGFGYLYG